MFDFDKFSVSKFYVAPSVERVVEFSPPGIDMQNIAKVLSLAVEAKCSSQDVYDGYAQIGGRTNFRLCYLDRESMPRTADYNADFTVRVDGEFTADDNISCTIKVVESDVQATDTLLLSAVLEVSVCALRRDEIEALTNADQCYKTQRTIYLPSFIASKTTTAPFEDEQEVGGEITSVLGLNVSCAVKRAEAVDGGALASANVYAVVTYVESGVIKQREFRMELEEELNLDGVQAGDSISVSACVKSSKIILQGVTDDNVIKVEGEIQFKVQAFRCSETEVVDDMFTLTNEVSVTRESRDYVCFDGCGFFSENVSGTAVLGDNRAPVIEVNALPYARCYTSKAYVDEDGKLAVEGIVNTDVIYTDENGYNSVRTEIPFSLSISSVQPFSKTVKVCCSIESMSAKVRREREIDIDLRLGVEVCGYSDVTAEFISAVEVGEEKPQNRSALSLYIANDGDEILDLCKALTAMPEQIIAQNPNLQFPLKEGDRVLYFRQANLA